MCTLRALVFVLGLAGVLGQLGGGVSYETYGEVDDDYYDAEADDPPTEVTPLPALSLDQLTQPSDSSEDYDSEEYPEESIINQPETVGTTEARTIPATTSTALPTTITTPKTTVTTTTPTTTTPTTTTPTTTTPTTTTPTTTTPTTTTPTTTTPTTTTPTTTTPTTTTTTTTEQPQTQPPPGEIHSPVIERGDQSPGLLEQVEELVTELPAAILETTVPTIPTTQTIPATTTRTAQRTTTTRSTTPVRTTTRSTTQVRTTTTVRTTKPTEKATAPPPAPKTTAKAVAQTKTSGPSSGTKLPNCPTGWTSQPDRETKVPYCVMMINRTISCVEDATACCEELEAHLNTPIPYLKKKLEANSNLATTLVCRRHPVYCCDKGWSIFCSEPDSCSCYNQYKEAKHWKKGNNCCRKLKATLVTIESEEENKFVGKFARQTVNPGDLVWLGLKKGKGEAYESVIDETPSFTKWAAFDPKQDQCVAMVVGTAKWVHSNCYRPQAVICESNPSLWMDTEEQTTSTTTTERQNRKRRHDPTKRLYPLISLNNRS